jgi:hypothetical protein
LEKGRREVEDKVYSGPVDILALYLLYRIKVNKPLLHHLKGSSKNRSAQITLCLPQRAAKAVHPRAKKVGAWDQSALVLFIRNDLSQFPLDVL